MKKMSFLRLTAIVALFAFAGLGAFAQYVGPTATYDAVTTTSDYVTIGSRVPYYVAPDGTIGAMATAGTMDYSEFQWEVLTSLLAPLAITPATYTDGALTVGEGLAPWVEENEISVTWAAPAVAGTQYVLRATEHSNPLGAGNFAFGCADLTPEVRNVFVLAAPTVAFNGTQGGGCSTAPGSTFYVPLNITGLGDWDVTYTVSYNGGAASAPATYTLTVADPIGTVTDANVIAESVLARAANGTPTTSTDGLAIVLPAAQYGYYDVAITGFTDRISRKSMDALTAVTAAGTYRIFVNPTPVTSPIQHLENL
ncbi:MAG: hypothetical protein JW830_05460 [Bacteroidales bacterium]|nr:hypothetical protein [Bacteroidales bacterium]